MRRRRHPKRRNPVARILRAGRFRQRQVRPRKGKGAYRRKPRHQPPPTDA